MPDPALNSHMWSECFDLTKLAPERRVLVAETLNWLEQHFPEFNSMVYDIRQGLAKEKLTKVEISEALTEDMGFDHGSGELDIDFKPKFYLGLDGKIHEASLNEVLVHELEHVVQHFKPLHNLTTEQAARINSEYQAAYKGLAAYLGGQGITNDRDLVPYMEMVVTGERGATLAAVTDTKEFKRLGGEFLRTFNAIEAPDMAREDGAIDRANILSMMLGKPPRGNHWDTNLLYYHLPALSGPLLVYTDTPEAIRQQQQRSWQPPADITLNPKITGHAGVRDGTLDEMQHDWNAKWNQNTKNITADEWRVIEQVKATLLSKRTLVDMAPETKSAIDAVTESMKLDFNQSSGNDVLSPSSHAGLKKHGQSEVAGKASQKGWSL